jgi:hypothetical protein
MLGRAGTPASAEPPGGGGDGSAVPGTTVWRAVAAGLPELYGSVWNRPDQYGPGVLLPLCLVDDRRKAAVEVGSSRMAGATVPVATMSCVSIFQATRYCPRRDGDGDFKTVVACAGGWQSLVVVLRCARVFCGQGSGEISVGLFEPDAVPPLVAPFLPEGRLGKPRSTILCMPGETLGPIWSRQ